MGINQIKFNTHKVEKHITGWLNFDLMSLKQVKVRLSSVCVWPQV